jgi:hypothetical protein
MNWSKWKQIERNLGEWIRNSTKVIQALKQSSTRRVALYKNVNRLIEKSMCVLINKLKLILKKCKTLVRLSRFLFSDKEIYLSKIRIWLIWKRFKHMRMNMYRKMIYIFLITSFVLTPLLNRFEKFKHLYNYFTWSTRLYLFTTE